MTLKIGKLQLCGSFQGNFKCTWVIEHFGSLDSKLGKGYLSETFEPEGGGGVKWFLDLYPGGVTEDCEGYVSCYLYISDANGSLNVKFDISFCNSEGDIVLKSKYEEDYCDDKWFIVQSGYGYRKSIAHHKLLNDILLITVEASYCRTYSKNDEEVYQCAEITPTMKLTEDWRKLWTSKDNNSDCVISVGEEDIHVHSIVLCARSEVFAAMFAHDTVEKSTRRVKITDFGKDTMRSLMEFIYSGNVREMDLDLASELLRASDKYEVSDLKTYCSDYMTSIMNDDNVCQVLATADICNAGKLRRKAIKYFCKFLSKVDFPAKRSILETRSELVCDIVQEIINLKKTELL